MRGVTVAVSKATLSLTGRIAGSGRGEDGVRKGGQGGLVGLRCQGPVSGPKQRLNEQAHRVGLAHCHIASGCLCLCVCECESVCC